jgi:hypothetical protein
MIAQSLAGADAMAVEETEIERIKRELDMLRERHALFQKCAKIMKPVLAIGIPLCLVVLVILLLPTLRTDPLFGGFVLALPIVLGGLVFWLNRRPHPEGPRHFLDSPRMIDFVSPLRLTLDPHFLTGPFSAAQVIEHMIATRERRLAELEAGNR